MEPYLRNKTKAIFDGKANPLPLRCRDIVNMHSVVNVYLQERKGRRVVEIS